MRTAIVLNLTPVTSNYNSSVLVRLFRNYEMLAHKT